MRATKRNRALVRDHRAFFRARFPVAGDRWLRALAGEAPAPSAPGLLWVDLRGTRLWGARLA
ncbi:MAG: hypothetical protein A2X23_04150 [Chloroflexi bacterium GWC2_73_18]|nr:MAG: hypothetical protein A2X23_04150 [Chloroflexi bacterium GWC2_73_18]